MTTALSSLVVAAWLLAAAAADEGADAAALAARERDLLDRYQEFERSLLRLADLLAATDPRRADAVRAAFEQARGEQLADRLAAIVGMLGEGQLLKAGTGQREVVAALRSLGDTIEDLSDASRSAEAARQARELAAKVAAVIGLQREIAAATEAGSDSAAESQRRIADRAGGLGDEVQRLVDRLAGGSAGAPGRAASAADGGGGPDAPGGPPDVEQPAPESAGGEPRAAVEGDDDLARSRRTGQRLRAAEERMRQAAERLDAAERRAARGEQERAIEELELARAELEQILRQMREEEVTRLLVQLESRLRDMLRAERAVAGDADRFPSPAASADRQLELEAARLSREQAAITAQAARALALLRDDGSAVAIPQALAQVHDDSAEATARLGRGDVGVETRGLLAEIVAGLEEMLAAVERARRDPRDDPGGGGGRQAAAGERPLVDMLAELKMLRTLQVRVTARTRRLSRVLDADAAVPEPEVREALGRLAGRQRAIERAARDIVEGLTE